MIKRYLIPIDREEFTVRESDAQATIQADRRRRTEKIVPTRDVLEVGISHRVPSSVICLATDCEGCMQEYYEANDQVLHNGSTEPLGKARWVL